MSCPKGKERSPDRRPSASGREEEETSWRRVTDFQLRSVSCCPSRGDLASQSVKRTDCGYAEGCCCIRRAGSQRDGRAENCRAILLQFKRHASAAARDQQVCRYSLDCDCLRCHPEVRIASCDSRVWVAECDRHIVR